MGKRIIKTEEMWDDLDAHVVEDVRTVRFSLNDQNYSIDLGTKNREALENALAEFIAKASTGTASATRSQAGSTRRARRSSEEVAAEKAERAEHKAYLDKVRSWAAKNGYTVGEKGRIAQNILDAYTKAKG